MGVFEPLDSLLRFILCLPALYAQVLFGELTPVVRRILVQFGFAGNALLAQRHINAVNLFNACGDVVSRNYRVDFG